MKATIEPQSAKREELIPQPQKVSEKNRQLKIFLVEDDQIVLHAIGHQLYKQQDCKVHCFSSGQECLENMYLKPDLVILDYFLFTHGREEMNGLEVLKKIKSIRPETMVVMLSAQKNLAIAVSSLKEGAHTYLIKNGQTFSQLLDIIQDLKINLGMF